jgi:Tfp pilus assembly protein PilE
MRFEHVPVAVTSAAMAIVSVLTSCGNGSSVVATDAKSSTSATTSSPVALSATSAEITRDTVSGIVARGTATQCKANLASFQVAFESYHAINGAYPLDITRVVPKFINEIPAGATLNDARTVLTVTEYAITYTLTYDPATGALSAATVAPPEYAGPGCP